MKDYEHLRKNWSKVVAKAWMDEEFKKKLLANPDQVLKEQGCAFPSGCHCKIHENNPHTIHLTLPEKPHGALSEEELRKVAGGFGCLGTHGH